jgi:ribosomal-protein-alanine N-acetyltransferase
VKIRPASEKDLMKLSGWFLTESEAKFWGGPSIHFPLSLKQLKIDIDWGISHSYALVDGGDNLLGFAQAFNKFGYKHLGRIIVSPKMRGRKLGYKLMATLLSFIRTKDMSFSLFVYADNLPAKNLYESIGFEARSYPDGKPEIKDCIFMVKET